RASGDRPCTRNLGPALRVGSAGSLTRCYAGGSTMDWWRLSWWKRLAPSTPGRQGRIGPQLACEELPDRLSPSGVTPGLAAWPSLPAEAGPAAQRVEVSAAWAEPSAEASALQKYCDELARAQEVQLSFLPTLPDVPGYEFFAHYQPFGKVGGDYYDFLPLPGQRLAATLGDVAGKGVPAALVLARPSAAAPSCLLPGAGPAAA